jgi:non-heme chloroperoxidase
MTMTTTERQPMSAASIHTVVGAAGTKLHVREWGRLDRPPLLLIHGWSGNHLCWTRQTGSELSDEFRLVALDLRGHGMSEHPLDANQYTDSSLWAADIAAVIDQCRLHQPVLVGWSYGGFIICDYVRAYGQDGIGAINFVGAAVTLDAGFNDIGPAFLAAAPAGADPDLPTRIAGLRRFWHSMTADPLDLADLETGLCSSISVPPQVLGALVSRHIDSDEVLAELRVPVLVTHGRRDQVVSPSMADHILEVSPTAQASWYDGVGHAPFLEDPARFNRELAELAHRVGA